MNEQKNRQVDPGRVIQKLTEQVSFQAQEVAIRDVLIEQLDAHIAALEEALAEASPGKTEDKETKNHGDTKRPSAA